MKSRSLFAVIALSVASTLSGCSPPHSASFTVTATGAHTSIAPLSASVSSGSTAAFAVTADAGYTLLTTVGGTCPGGRWSGSSYTTGAITATCTVAFSATLTAFQVTASGDSDETIDPATAQTVTSGDDAAFTVTAKEGYTLSTSVGGTCPQGTWAGAVYTTGAVTASCAVAFSATPKSYQVTRPSARRLRRR